MVDLHAHSTYSDGTLTPTELARSASEINLTAIALTDHNNVGGIPEFLSAAEKYGIDAVAGAEFSTEFKGTELHLVALFIDEEHIPSISLMMEQALALKRESNRRLISDINRHYGCEIDHEKLEAENPGLINRVHIARKLMELGLLTSVKEGFETVLSPINGLYVPPKRIATYDMIRTLRQMKAIPILAHPYLSMSEELLASFLPEATECGLIGIECLYSTFTPHQTKSAFENARHYGLIPSGGSDFHGANKPDILLGRGRGDLNVPDSVYYALKDKKAKI